MSTMITVVFKETSTKKKIEACKLDVNTVKHLEVGDEISIITSTDYHIIDKIRWSIYCEDEYTSMDLNVFVSVIE
jgi:hypothetical protein